MEFSDVYQQHGGHCRFSPNGKYVAYRVDHRVIIRDAETMGVVQLKSCLDKIQTIEWSCDSLYYLCGMYKRGLVQVFSLEQADWEAKIDEGSAGLTHVRWSPDGRHVLTTADFQLRITVWSLVSQQVNYLKFPKFSGAGCAFSHDGEYMAVLERADCKDVVSVFACKRWEMVKNFAVDTVDASDISWSPDDRTICVWDSLVNYRVLAYQPDGRLIGDYSAYQDALGVKTVEWSPSGQFLAIGSYDEGMRLVNNVTWKKISEHSHPSTIESSNVVTYREVEAREPTDKLEAFPHTGGLHVTTCKYELETPPVAIERIKADPEKPFPRLGVGIIGFSPDSRYIATRNDNMPCAVWIWDVASLSQVVLLKQMSAIRVLEWHPTRQLLAIATGSGSIYFWSPSGCLCAQVPTDRNFSVMTISWAPDGSTLLVMDKDRFCLCFTATGLESLEA